MKCSQCGFENPEGLKFCGDCGAKIEIVCPNCQFPNPPQFKFCGNCGHIQKALEDTRSLLEDSRMLFEALDTKATFERLFFQWRKFPLPPDE